MTGPSGAPAAISDGVPSYRACSTKRTRRKKTEIARIKAAIYDIVKGDRPMTVRQVFYQLVVRDLIEKTEKEYETTVIRLLTNMRLSGELPFEWIIDESRRRRITQTFAQYIAAAGRAEKYSYIYQFGDHDPSGVLIPRSIESRLTELCEKFGCEPPLVERVALTEAHIKQFNLPTRPTKARRQYACR